MTYFLMLCTGLLLALANVVQGADTSAGARVYDSCMACHGAGGEGNVTVGGPALAGQHEAYLVRQLKNFRAGLRGADASDARGMQMRGMAAALADDAAVGDVAAYLAGLPQQAQNAKTAGADMRNAENQYNAACGACHGGQAQGNVGLRSPRLAGLDAAYLKLQYQNFGTGIRGSHPDDRLGQQMKMMATMLPSEKDLDDVVAFIVSQ